MGIVVWQCRRVSDPVTTTMVSLVVFLGVLASSNERPQLVSFAILACLAPVMLRRTQLGRAMPWASLVVWPLWANAHGLWVVALALYALLVAIRAASDRWAGRATWRPMVVYWGLAMSLICVNPAGPKLLLAPLQVREYAQFVSEWDAPNLWQLPGAALAVLTLIIAISWARDWRAVDAYSIGYVILAAAIGVQYLRSVPVGCLLLAPLAAQSFVFLKRSWSPAASPKWPGKRATLFSSACVIVIGFCR